MSYIIAYDRFKKREVGIYDESRYLNTLVIGQKGTGKSDYVLFNMFYQDMEHLNHSIFVFTSKGDTSYKLYGLAKQAGRKVHLLKPETHTFHIDLLKGEEQEVIDSFLEIFVNSSTAHEASRMLLINALKVVKRLYGDKGTLEDVYELISNVGEGRKKILQFSKLNRRNEKEARENSRISSWFINEYFHDNFHQTFEQCADIRTQMAMLLENPSYFEMISSGDDLPDLKKVIKNKEVVIVDTEFLKYKDFSRLMGSFLLLKIKNELIKEEKANAYLYIDDFHQYYPVLTELFEGSHVKSIGITIFLQSTNQLNAYPVYKKVIFNNVENVILLERLSMEDYELYKDQMNGALLNRSRGDIVYRIINKDGATESASGTFYSVHKNVLNDEKYKEYKKKLRKKKSSKTKNEKRNKSFEKDKDLKKTNGLENREKEEEKEYLSLHSILDEEEQELR